MWLSVPRGEGLCPADSADDGRAALFTVCAGGLPVLAALLTFLCRPFGVYSCFPKFCVEQYIVFSSLPYSLLLCSNHFGFVILSQQDQMNTGIQYYTCK